MKRKSRLNQPLTKRSNERDGGYKCKHSGENLEESMSDHSKKFKDDPKVSMKQNLRINVRRFDACRPYDLEKVCQSDGRNSEYSVRSSSDATEKYKNISFLACGSFNPVTNMHLRMFEIAKDYFQNSFKNVKVGTGILSPVCDDYAKQGLESSDHRLKMCSLAIKDNPWLQLSSWESEQSNWTPTLQVLQHCQDFLNNKVLNLMLLCGADLLESFTKPGLWRGEEVTKILEQFGVVVIQRPSFDPLKIVYESDLLYSQRENIHIITDWIKNDISSTKVRRALRRNESIRYLTPDPVVRYITNHNLYASNVSENTHTNCVLAPYRRDDDKE